MARERCEYWMSLVSDHFSRWKSAPLRSVLVDRCDTLLDSASDSVTARV